MRFMTRMTPLPSFSSPRQTQVKFGKIEEEDYDKLVNIMLRPGNKETFEATADFAFFTVSDNNERSRLFEQREILTLQSMNHPKKWEHAKNWVTGITDPINPFVSTTPKNLIGAKADIIFSSELAQLKSKNQKAWTSDMDFWQHTTLTPASLEKLNRLSANA
jgi:hypothetical protein